jgi:hypothetical protein
MEKYLNKINIKWHPIYLAAGMVSIGDVPAAAPMKD